MVMCHGRLDEVVPLENASMPNRVVVQWDKDDCADMGIVKVDLLGLGMMAAIQEALTLINTPMPQVDLAHLPADDPEVYGMLQQADTIGVFQVESRAQMATLPRLRPERFYDLVVEVAIIRPGPIVGQMVHPYLNRRRVENRCRIPIHRWSRSSSGPLGCRCFKSSSYASPWLPLDSPGGRRRSCGEPWGSSGRSGG